MISDILLAVTDFIVRTVDQLGYTGVVVLMAIESAAIPLPSEIIMPFSGFLVASGRFTLLGLGLAGALGSLIGSVVTYALGFYGGRPLIIKYGRFVLITEHDLALTEKFFQKFGKASVFIGRLLPVVRTFISIPAGVGRVPFGPFALYSFIGSFFWSYLLAWLGVRLGANWENLKDYFHKFDLLIGLLLAVGLAYWIMRHLKGRVGR